MVGVTDGWRGKRLGTALMTHAFERTLLIAEHAGCHCLWLNAVDEETAVFYEGLQFERIKPGALEMYVSIDTIADALGATQ